MSTDNERADLEGDETGAVAPEATSGAEIAADPEVDETGADADDEADETDETADDDVFAQLRVPLELPAPPADADDDDADDADEDDAGEDDADEDDADEDERADAEILDEDSEPILHDAPDDDDDAPDGHGAPDGHDAPDDDAPDEAATAVIHPLVPAPAVPSVEFDASLPIAERATALVRRWLSRSETFPTDPSAERLAGVLKDPDGLDFTVGFVDGVARPEDLSVAAERLSELAAKAPRFLPGYMRAAIVTGGAIGPLLPFVVVPAARKVLRQMVGHLVVDATPAKLGAAIEKLRGGGDRLNLNLLGEAVLGEKEANKRLDGTRRLLARPDVDYVSIKVSSVVSQLSMWAFDDAVERVAHTLTPLYELAASSPSPKFINLDMEEYRDLDLTIAAFTRILDQPGLDGLEAGIVLQAYLPDALGALDSLTEWAQERVAAGGAPIKVRLVKGANLAMERVDASIHDWPLATYGSKRDTDTNYKRVLDAALTPERTAAVKIGVAGHNLFDIAHAWILANERGVTGAIEFEMLLGMATGQAQAIKEDVGRLLLYTPVVRPSEFDVAISYLIRRLEENASQENFMSAVFELSTHEELFERERVRFVESLEALETGGRSGADARADAVADAAAAEATAAPRPTPNRTQDRAREWASSSGARLVQSHAGARQHPRDPGSDGLTQAVLGLSRGSSGGIGSNRFGAGAAGPGAAGAGAAGAGATGAASGGGAAPRASVGQSFHNEPDTDPSLPANRAWAKRILDRVAASQLGQATIGAARISDSEKLERVIRTVATRAERWGDRLGYDRAAILDRAGLALAANRDRLIEVMASETGKTIAEGDPEVSEAIDFAHYYATLARELDAISGATFVPSRVTVVAPPWNFPIAIPAGSVFAALAAGSGVILKPAPQARRSAALLAEILWEIGIPKDLLALVDIDEGDLGTQLISSPLVDRVILTGAYETAALFRSWRPDLPLLAETSGKNAIIVTPSADFDLAVNDIVKSAFGHAGQKCSAASLVILVGSVARSKRFRDQLVDAVTSLRVGLPDDARSQVGPLIEPASGKLEHALTTLGADERWLVEPRRLDADGRLWSPGVKEGVRPESYFHLTEFFGPVLGIMHAATLDEAIGLQNASDYGLTAGLHSLDSVELATWLDGVEAGNLYVNRGITGAIVRRQPFGGWKRSSVGAGTKAGGPNYLIGLGSWLPVDTQRSTTLHLRGLDDRSRQFIEAAQSSLTFEQFDLLRRSALSDQLAWGTEFGIVSDVSQVEAERNLFRYLRVPVAIRLADDGDLGELLRVVSAGLLTRSRLQISSSVALPAGVRAILQGDELSMLAGLIPVVVVETDEAWLGRLRAGEFAGSRVRIVGGHGSRDAQGRRDRLDRGDDVGDTAGSAEAETDARASDAPDDELAQTRSFTDVVEGITRGSRAQPIVRLRPDGTRIPLATLAAEAVGGSPDVAIYAEPVTSVGRIELLPFLREQAISITAHRFGNPSDLSDGLL